jgi:tetratricopeptide (TPR) repeat protein
VNANCGAGAALLCLLRYVIAVIFEEALKGGDLDQARAILDELADLPQTSGLHMAECYADLARAYHHHGRHDDAIAAMERAIEHGWSGRPDARSDIAEFHLRAGRADEAAAIWAELKGKDPGDVWLYNAAGLSYSETGDHELAVTWLGEGLELAMRTNDPDGVAAQLSDVRRRSLATLGRELDALEHRVDRFLPAWRARTRERDRARLREAFQDADTTHRAPTHLGPGAGTIPVALAWFPSGEYERAVGRWPDLAESWAEVPHGEYCHRFDGHIKWLRSQGVDVRAVAPIAVDDYTAWCEERGDAPEHARAAYAAQVFAAGDAIPWPPARNQSCWCGSQRKYKRCCGTAASRPMHDRQP